VIGVVVPLVSAGRPFVMEFVAIGCHVAPPSSDRWITWPNQPRDVEARGDSFCGDP